MNKKLYRFTKDYPLSGNKVGDKITLSSVSHALSEHLEEVIEEGPGNDVPDESWLKDDIIAWLSQVGVQDAKGTKEELLKEVKKVLRHKS